MNDNHEADATGELGSTAGAEGKESQPGPGEQGMQAPANKVVRVHSVLRVVPAGQAGAIEAAEPADQPQPSLIPAPQPMYAPFPAWQVDAPPAPNRPPSPTLFQAYRQAFLHPSAEGMASEVPAASWLRVWTGLIISGSSLVGFAYLLILAAAVYVLILGGVSIAASGAAPGQAPLDAARIATAMLDYFEVVLLSLGGAGLSTLTFAAYFFVDALVLYWLCRSMGGVGRTGDFRSDFKVHSYLLSLVAVPMTVVRSAVVFVPLVGSCASLVIPIYGIFLQYYALRASMQLTRSNARTVIILSFIVTFLLTIMLFVALAVLGTLTNRLFGAGR